MVGLIDYGMGNLASVRRAFEHLQVPIKVLSNPFEIHEVQALVLPGVGSFHQAMGNLHAQGWVSALHEAVMVRKVPILGICLGMQLFATVGEEGGETSGLGWIEGKVVRIPAHGLPLTHIGWNEITVSDAEWLSHGGDQNYYFIHQFCFQPANSADVAAWVDYGEPIVAALHRGHLFATQFHPEKSQSAGLAVLRKFLDLALNPELA